MSPDARIYVAGHRGLVGSALLRTLQLQGYSNLITRRHSELELTDQTAVRAFFADERPDYVFLAAAKVGGIYANSTYPAEFIYQNLALQTHIIDAAYRTGVKRLLFLGSSCIYPRDCPQPIREEYLLSAPLEPSNRPYAVAKIAGIEMCSAYNRQYATRYLPVMPTNLYGPGDNFDPLNAHVLPALIRRFHEARQCGASSVIIWGTGTPRREFLYSDDLAEACVLLMNLPDDQFSAILQAEAANPPLVNIGCGKDLTIRKLAERVAAVVGFEGRLEFDTSKPDGTPCKRLDVSKLARLGWQARTPLHEGIALTYQWFLENYADPGRDWD